MKSQLDIARRLADLERKVNSISRVGVVSAVDRTKCKVRVTFERNVVSNWLPVMVKQSSANRDFWMPALDEQVFCVFLPSGQEIGFVIGSFYSDEDAIPDGADAEGLRVVEFSDGARIEYSTEDSIFRLIVGDIELTITSDLVQIGGDGASQPFVRGNDLKDWLSAHVHPTGVGPSGPPSTAGTLGAVLSEIIKGR